MYPRSPHNTTTRSRTEWHGDVLFLVLQKHIAFLLLLSFVPSIFGPLFPTHHDGAHHDKDYHGKKHDDHHSAHKSAHTSPYTSVSAHASEHAWGSPHESHHHEHPDHVEPEEWEEEREERRKKAIAATHSWVATSHIVRDNWAGSLLRKRPFSGDVRPILHS